MQESQESKTSEYNIDTWGIEEGLPQSSVNAILQTRDGFIWLGTFGGLVRFDGINFVVYNRGNTPSMTTDRILALMEDTSGTMWIGTENGGVMTLRNGIFSSYTTKEGLADDRVDVLLQDSSGSVWVNNISGNITRYFKGTFRPYDIGVSLGTYFSLSAQGALQCLYDEKTFVFENEKFVPYFQHPIYNRLFSVPPVWDNKGNFWICRDGRVLSCFKDGKEMKRVSIPENLHIMVERNMKFDNDGNLWMISMGGAVRFDGTSFRLYSTNDGLSANQIISLLIDREGNCWFGTLTSGLNRFRKKMFTVVISKEKEAINNITSISHLHEGTIIFGLNCNGYKLWKDNSFLSTSPYPNNINPCVWSVFEDSRRTLWLGTWGNGVYKSQVAL
ncbi:MAG: hypothetical protein HYZ34_11240, partial [Ignavibacteriae bacterium]|nr:hypothetical protein [Ignavibacteriota bacterium]